MSTAASVESRIDRVDVTEDTITAHLVDGRVISVPLAWSWRLAEATPAQRANWQLIGGGHGVHWPDVDEDISAEGTIHGMPARRPRRESRSQRTPPKLARQPTNRRGRSGTVKRRSRAARG